MATTDMHTHTNTHHTHGRRGVVCVRGCILIFTHIYLYMYITYIKICICTCIYIIIQKTISHALYSFLFYYMPFFYIKKMHFPSHVVNFMIHHWLTTTSWEHGGWGHGSFKRTLAGSSCNPTALCQHGAVPLKPHQLCGNMATIDWLARIEEWYELGSTRINCIAVI